MRTTVDGIEITPGMINTFERWYSNAISHDDTLPYGYVRELSELQDFLCTMIHDVDAHPEIKDHISLIINLKKDMRSFIPEKFISD